MAMVDDSCLQADSQRVRWLGLGVDGRLCAALHSSNEPSELSQNSLFSGHDDSTINIVLGLLLFLLLLYKNMNMQY